MDGIGKKITQKDIYKDDSFTYFFIPTKTGEPKLQGRFNFLYKLTINSVEAEQNNTVDAYLNKNKQPNKSFESKTLDNSKKAKEGERIKTTIIKIIYIYI